MEGNRIVYFQCNRCGYKEKNLFGSGLFWPAYDDIVRDVSSGKYGLKWAELFQRSPGAVIDHDYELYVCPDCNSRRNEVNLSVYVPRKPEEICPDYDHRPFLEVLAERRRGKRMLSLRKAHLQNCYRQKPYIHRCDGCRRRMHKYSHNDILLCPVCREGQMEETEWWIWD